MQSSGKFMNQRRAISALLCATVLSPCALLADKTTNTYTRTSSASADITWSTAGLPSDVTTTAGSDISIKIDYAEGGEKYQRIKTATLPIYLDSVIGGKYHNLSFVAPGNQGLKYAVVNDPTPFEGFWSIDAGPARTSGIYLPDNGGAGPRTIGSAFLRGRFQFGVAPGCEAFLDYPFGLGMFEVNRSMDSQTPKGKLTVNRSPGPYGVAQVRAGTLGIVGGDDDTSSPVPGAWARFDVLAEDSFAMDSEGNVTTWNDADGNGVSMSVEYNANKPIRREDSVTGKTLVDFCIRSGIADRAKNGSRLKFPEAKDGIAEVFFVFRDNSGSDAAHILDTAFPRQGNKNYLFKGWGSLPNELAMGEFRLNGQAVVPDVVYDFTRGLNVVSAGYRSGGGRVMYVAGADGSPSAGGLQFAEILLYTNALSAAERRHNNDYLMKKWLGSGVRDYGAIMLDKTASLSVESGTARVRELQLATNGFVKAGSGNLEVESLNTNLNALAVNGGLIRFVNTLERSANPQPAADPFAWFDADDETSLDTFPSNYNDTATTFVTEWRDKRSNGYTLARVGAVSHKNCGDGTTAVADETALPTLDTTTLASHQMIDLGPFYNPSASKHYGWINGNSGLSTWLRLYKNGSANGDGTRQGFVVFYKTNGNGNPINSTGWDLRNAGGSNPKNYFLSDSYAGVGPLGGHWTYDGATVNPGQVSLPADGKAHLGSFMFADGTAQVNVFGGDMDVGGNSSGGCKIAEVILYDRVLTEQERLDTERYLMAKWNCGTHPADKNISSVGTLSFGDGVDAVFDNESDMTIGRVDRESSGAIVKKGAGAATVAVFDPNAHDVTAVTVESGSLTLTCDPLADAWTHLDASRADSIEYTTTDGTNYVSKWKDISGHGNDATTAAGLLCKPTWHTVHLDADNMLADSGREMMVVDMGEYYNNEQLGVSDWTPTNSASGMNFPQKTTALQEFYVVHADTDHMNGTNKSNYNGILGFVDWADTNVNPDAYPFMRTSRTPFIGTTGTPSLQSGYVGVNGETSSCSYGPTLRQLNVYTVSAANQISKGQWALARRMSAQWGGQVLGEVIMFQNANTVERRNAITAMLLNKWRGQQSEEPLTSSWTLGSVTVANGSSLTVGGADGFAYTATTLGGLGTITSGPKILGVANVVVGAEGTAGTLTLASDVTLASGAFIDVYADDEGHISNVAMTGKLTIGGSGTVRLHVPEGAEIAYGEYTIAAASSIAISDPTASWTLVADGLQRGKAKVEVDLVGGRVVVRVFPTGLSLIFR